MLAIVLASLSFVYFFTEPLFTFTVSPSDVPSALILSAFAALIAWFSSMRRAVERDLRHTRDQLQVEVHERKHREDDIRGLNVEWKRGLESSKPRTKSWRHSPIRFRMTCARRSGTCRVRGAAPETGVIGARPEKSAAHEDDSGLGTADGQSD